MEDLKEIQKVIGIGLKPSTILKLKAIAETESRSLNNLMNKIIEDYLRNLDGSSTSV